MQSVAGGTTASSSRPLCPPRLPLSSTHTCSTVLSLPLLPLGSPIHQVRVAKEIFLNNAQLGGRGGGGGVAGAAAVGVSLLSSKPLMAPHWPQTVTNTPRPGV